MIRLQRHMEAFNCSEKDFENSFTDAAKMQRKGKGGKAVKDDGDGNAGSGKTV